jgi:hypothetical protein
MRKIKTGTFEVGYYFVARVTEAGALWDCVSIRRWICAKEPGEDRLPSPGYRRDAIRQRCDTSRLYGSYLRNNILRV